jgi:hypothetical protein
MALCIAEIQLGVTIRPLDHGVREEACVEIFSWIAKNLGSERFRIAFCKALCSSFNVDELKQVGGADVDLIYKALLCDLVQTTSIAETRILDWFLIYDLKLWKRFRLLLHEIYIATLLVHTSYKKIFGTSLQRRPCR